MIKLARNALGDMGNFYNAQGETISWAYIEKLCKLQDDQGFSIANKLTTVHTNWQKHKMRVKLAAQTLSSSVADALEFLKDDMMAEDFKNCGATVQFIRNIDRLFDLLNSRHPMMKGFKSPISKSNLSTVQNQVRKVCEYLLSLKASDSQLLAENRRKSFILGFVSAAKSIIAIAEDLLTRESNQLKYLLTYKFSQDHIELLFSCIRSRGGFNNNPNALQFKTALRQILLRNSIMASNKANVICFEDQAHGSIFSLKASKRRTPISDILEQPSSEEDAEDNDWILLLLFDGIEFTSFLENILYYISGFIVRKIANKIDCEQCAEALAFPTSSMDHPYVNLPFSLASLSFVKTEAA